MRVVASLLAIGVATAISTLACAASPSGPMILGSTITQADIDAQWSYKHKSLDGPDALAELQASNPLHYGIVRKILAAASEICDAAAKGPIPIKFEAKDVTCAHGFWMTSNPPKRALEFRIEDTVYTALVAVTLPGAKLKPAR